MIFENVRNDIIKYWFDVIVNIANEGSIYSSGMDGRLTGWIIIT